MNGWNAEIEGTIEAYKRLYPQLKVIATGGDVKYFENKIKEAIFVVPELVLSGLYRVAEFNAFI